MYKHHEESIEKMIGHYRENPEVKALFLVGSVATGTERANSDLDCVAVVSNEHYEALKKTGGDHESVFGKSTYSDGGYFDNHFMSKEHLEHLAKAGTEPWRNMFTDAKVLFSDDSNLEKIVAQIPVYPESERAEKQLRFYCTFNFLYTYYLKICKPEGFMKDYVANGMVYNLYRLILLENNLLFPSLRKLEMAIEKAPNKPEGIMEKCQRFMDSMSVEDGLDLLDSYKAWTSYDYPPESEFQFIANNYFNPLEY
ncbi:MAG: nucleotidyltransferase domain-containing protein [Turicibacter sp.]|nr:nucleotidyltransferase domain-containing protein [Turicibacter sp.]